MLDENTVLDPTIKEEGAEQGQGDGGPDAGEKKQIDMAEAERIANEREERAGRAALTSYFKQHGMSEAEAKQAFDTFRADREARELAAHNDLSQLQVRVQAMEQEREQILHHANMQRVKAEAMLQALSMSIRPDRVDHVIRLADLASIPFDDQGEPDKNAIRGVLDNVVAQTPEFKASAETEDHHGFKLGASPPGGQENIKGQLDQIFELD